MALLLRLPLLRTAWTAWALAFLALGGGCEGEPVEAEEVTDPLYQEDAEGSYLLTSGDTLIIKMSTDGDSGETWEVEDVDEAVLVYVTQFYSNWEGDPQGGVTVLQFTAGTEGSCRLSLVRRNGLSVENGTWWADFTVSPGGN